MLPDCRPFPDAEVVPAAGLECRDGTSQPEVPQKTHVVRGCTHSPVWVRYTRCCMTADPAESFVQGY
jgi:hypothetical protein